MMKKRDFVQIKGSDLKELWLKVKDIKGEIANLTLDKNMKNKKDLKMISKRKKDMAQILTVIRQNELLEQLESRVQQENSRKSVIASEATPKAGEAKQSSTVIKKIATSSPAASPRNDKRRTKK